MPTYGDFEVRLKNDGRSIETCLDVFSIRKTSFQYVSWCRPQESVFVDYEMVVVDDDSPPACVGSGFSNANTEYILSLLCFRSLIAPDCFCPRIGTLQ